MEHESFQDGYDISSLADIKMQLSVESNFEEFEKSTETEFLYETFTEYLNSGNFIEKFELDDLKNFQKDMVKINNVYVGFYKLLKEKGYSNVGISFIVFCDYFNLSYERTYKLLHPKIQLGIEKYLRNKIGNVAYNKTKEKFMPDAGKNIFDLIR